MSSRAQIHCGHCGTGPIERRHLKYHTERVHKGMKVFERAPASQSTLKVVRTSDLKRVHSVESTVEGAKVQRSEVFDDDEVVTMEEIVVPEKTSEANEHEPKEVTNEDLLVEIKEAKEQILNSVIMMQNSSVAMDKIHEDENGQLYTPSDSWTHNCPTFRQLNTPLDSWTQNCLTIGQLQT